MVFKHDWVRSPRSSPCVCSDDGEVMEVMLFVRVLVQDHVSVLLSISRTYPHVAANVDVFLRRPRIFVAVYLELRVECLTFAVFRAIHS
eukprot:3913208-Amphidinium_carterae.1